MSKRKVCVVVTARPSYSRVRSAMYAMQQHADLELQVVVGSSAMLRRYGNTIQYIEGDGFKVNARIYNIIEGENLTTMAKSAGVAIVEISTVFDNLKPDCVISIADRYETLSTSTAAAYMNIPLVHLQGGEVTGSIDEKVRHANTKLADVHLVSTKLAAERVYKMGEDRDRIYVTGCPSIDIARTVQEANADHRDIYQHYANHGVGADISVDGDYLIVMQHPVTTEYNLAKEHVQETLHAIHEMGVPTIWFWPNVDAGSDGTSKGIRQFRELVQPTNIRFLKNMLPEHFLTLLLNSRAIIGNSSTAIREASFLGVPAVNIGIRQRGRERGDNVVDTSYVRSAITQAIFQQIEHGPYSSQHLYGDGNAGEKIANILASHEFSIEKQLNY